MDKLDYKKIYKEFYAPQKEPSLITIPAMNFIMVNGKGNPNDPDGEYQQALTILYALTFTIKMGRKFGTIGTKNDEFVDYHVPPLEGLWWLDNDLDMDFTQKSKYNWISMIRQPEFITMDMFLQAQEQVKKKKPMIDVCKARFETFEEGFCVQCMHIGPFDDEPATIAKIDNYIKDNELIDDISTVLSDGHIRRHHEIYMNDARKVNPQKMKTILRHPVKYNSLKSLT